MAVSRRFTARDLSAPTCRLPPGWGCGTRISIPKQSARGRPRQVPLQLYFYSQHPESRILRNSMRKRGLIFSTRHTCAFVRFESADPLSSIKRLNPLTSQHRLLYIRKVLEETGSPRAASNTSYRRGAGFVGAGFGHGFKDSSYISVQISLLGITAEVSQLGRFVLGKPFVCAAQPREGVTE